MSGMYEDSPKRGAIEEMFDDLKRWLNRDFIKNIIIAACWAFACGWLLGSCTCGIIMCGSGETTETKVRVTTTTNSNSVGTPAVAEENEEESEFGTTGTYRYTLSAPGLTKEGFYLDSYTIDSYGNLNFLELETNKNFILKGDYFLREDNHYGKKEEKH